MGPDQHIIGFGTNLLKRSVQYLIHTFDRDNMATSEGMETYAARLASFDIAHPTAKRRTSTAKGAKTVKWQHKTPSPADVNPSSAQ